MNILSYIKKHVKIKLFLWIWTNKILLVSLYILVTCYKASGQAQVAL